MSEAGPITLPPRLAKTLVLLVGGFAITPVAFVIDFTRSALYEVPQGAVDTLLGGSALQDALGVAVYLALGWFMLNPVLFRWLVIGFAAFRIVPACLVIVMNLFSEHRQEPPFDFVEQSLTSLAIGVVPPLLALVAGHWLRRTRLKHTGEAVHG